MLLYIIRDDFYTGILWYLSNNFFNPAHLPVNEADLNAMRVGGRTGQDILQDALGQPASLLVLFQDDPDAQTGFELQAGGNIHHANRLPAKFKNAWISSKLLTRPAETRTAPEAFPSMQRRKSSRLRR